MTRARGWIEIGAILTLSGVAVAVACGGTNADARYPQRQPGCDVKVYGDTPDTPTENLGPVQASCSDDTPAEACMRTLKDAVCNLGGDVVWGVGEPTKDGAKIRFFGRAAHSKAPRSAASAR